MKCRTLEILHSEQKTESGKKNEQSLKRAVELKQNRRLGLEKPPTESFLSLEAINLETQAMRKPQILKRRKMTLRYVISKHLKPEDKKKILKTRKNRNASKYHTVNHEDRKSGASLRC